MFIDAYLALVTAAGAGTATEVTLPGYNRQPISFGQPVNGICFSATAFSFGQAFMPNGVVGRAIYDAPTGGNLLLVLPFPIPLAGTRLPRDSGDQNFLRLAFSALTGVMTGAAYTGRIAADAAAGLTSDRCDIVTMNDLSQSMSSPRPLINTATMTAGVTLSINRGVLQAASLVPAGTE